MNPIFCEDSNMRWQAFSSFVLFAALLGAQTPEINGPFVLFMGPPGSGKSTQGKIAAEKMNIPLVSVEELIRDNKAVFDKIRRTGLKGMEPQTDPVLNRLFEARLKSGDLSKGAILDGYPNTKDHADFLGKLVTDGRLPKPVVIRLAIPDDIVRERLLQQPGSTAESVEQRLKDYYREMSLVHVYFPEADITAVDGTESRGSVAAEVLSVLKERFAQ